MWGLLGQFQRTRAATRHSRTRSIVFRQKGRLSNPVSSKINGIQNPRARVYSLQEPVEGRALVYVALLRLVLSRFQTLSYSGTIERECSEESRGRGLRFHSRSDLGHEGATVLKDSHEKV